MAPDSGRSHRRATHIPLVMVRFGVRGGLLAFRLVGLFLGVHSRSPLCHLPRMAVGGRAKILSITSGIAKRGLRALEGTRKPSVALRLARRRACVSPHVHPSMCLARSSFERSPSSPFLLVRFGGKKDVGELAPFVLVVLLVLSETVNNALVPRRQRAPWRPRLGGRSS
jgi:hypothetical protein